jgi:hypothetical protein
MGALRPDFRLLLENDTALSSTLTGGIFDATELGRNGLQIEQVQDAQGRIKPCAVIRWRANNPFPPEPIPAERQFVEVYLYEDTGYTNIEAAIKRMKTLLHRKYIISTDHGLAWVRWAGDLGEMEAEELGNCPMNRSRFEIIKTRK